jgi:hypothetical protein
VDGQERRGGGAAAGQLLDDQAGIEARQCQAAGGLRRVHAHEAELAGGGEGSLGKIDCASQRAACGASTPSEKARALSTKACCSSLREKSMAASAAQVDAHVRLLAGGGLASL